MGRGGGNVRDTYPVLIQRNMNPKTLSSLQHTWYKLGKILYWTVVLTIHVCTYRFTRVCVFGACFVETPLEGETRGCDYVTKKDQAGIVPAGKAVCLLEGEDFFFRLFFGRRWGGGHGSSASASAIRMSSTSTVFLFDFSLFSSCSWVDSTVWTNRAAVYR